MEDFMRACGAKGPLELTVENRGLTAVRWSAHQPFALIGRDPAADLSLDHPRVDGHHAYLQVIDGGLFWVDLGSHTGTRRENGTARSGWLDHNHGIGIGPYVIQVAAIEGETSLADPAGSDRPDPFTSRPQSSDDLPRVVLEFRRDSAKPIRWRMRHVLTLVGSSTHCKVRLSAPGVSPFHCSLVTITEGVWVVNLLGDGGVTLNGSAIRAGRLFDADELMVGDVLIRVFLQTPTAENEEIGSSADGPIERAALVHPLKMPSRELVKNRPNGTWLEPGRESGSLIAERVSAEEALSATLLTSVMDQFGQMQQQFFEQFQQTTVMMFRALGAMHQDQMKELRDKIDSLHQISENLQTLQAHIGTNPPPVSPAPAQAHPYSLPSQSGPPRGSSGDHAVSKGEGVSVAPASREPHAPSDQGVQELRANVRSVVDQSNNIDTNVHEWLIDRIAAIEDEQRTCWQKILDMVRGR